MADLYLTLSKVPADAAERFAATLLRADATDLNLAFVGKDMTAHGVRHGAHGARDHARGH